MLRPQQSAVIDSALPSRAVNAKFMRDDMAKGQQRSNREKKKPKQAKDKPTSPASVFSALNAKPGAPAGKKK